MTPKRRFLNHFVTPKKMLVVGLALASFACASPPDESETDADNAQVSAPAKSDRAPAGGGVPQGIGTVSPVVKEAAPATSDEVITVTSALTAAFSRTDVRKTIELNPGSWGVWSEKRYCPPGAFAVGYKMRIEKNQGDGDDSSLNAVELHCMDGNGLLSTALAHDGLWGDWNESRMCTGGAFLTGGAIQFESSQGSGDDTAANDVAMKCGNGTDLRAPGGRNIGAWVSAKSCDAGTSVCGISVRFEGKTDDNSALNAVRLECCTNPSPSASRLVVSEFELDGVRTRTFSPNGRPSTPLAIVEGFDVDKDYTIEKLTQEITSQLIAQLANYGYGVSIIDLKSKNWEAIQSNARRVGAVVQSLWNNSAKVRPVKLLGVSMGGLIAATTAAMRHSPATLGEASPNWTFELDHLTTLDSPHGGAYIPKAIFNLVRRLNEHNDSAGARYGAFASAASQQMALIPFAPEYETNRLSWQTYYAKVLQTLRVSPIRTVAVVDGSMDNTPLNAGWTPGLQNIYHSRSTAKYDLMTRLYTQPVDGGLVARIILDIVGPHYESKDYFQTPGTWPQVENAPGGYGTFWKSAADSLDRNVPPQFAKATFVPSWSAAGISFNEAANLPENLRNDLARLSAERGGRGNLYRGGFTPFERVIAGTTNEGHTKLPPHLVQPMLADLKSALSSRYLSLPWGSPYGNNMSVDAPLNPGCPGQWKLTFDYAFENGYDSGHFQRLDTNEIEALTGTGMREYTLTGGTHWAVFTDSSVTAMGFTKIRATCL